LVRGNLRGRIVPKTTPQDYFDCFVRPNFDEFYFSSDDLRLAFNASVSAFQQADIFWQFYDRNNPQALTGWPSYKEFLKDLSWREPAFLTVQSVATVYKHFYAAGSHYEIGSPGAVWGSVFTADRTKIESRWGNDEHGTDVVVRVRGKPLVSLKAALEAVVTRLWTPILDAAETASSS
jgi:hypothetical protein